MMVIYRIENDGFRFQELDLEIDDFIENFPDDYDDVSVYEFSRNNLALSKYWPPMATGFSQIEGNENLIPDVTYWIGATLLLSPRAYRFLGNLLSPFGEFLPIYIDREKYLIFNCLTIAGVANPDAIDDNYIFDMDDVENKVAFKPPKEFSMRVCCNEQMKNAIEGFGLKGVVFSKISLLESS